MNFTKSKVMTGNVRGLKLVACLSIAFKELETSYKSHSREVWWTNKSVTTELRYISEFLPYLRQKLKSCDLQLVGDTHAS